MTPQEATQKLFQAVEARNVSAAVSAAREALAAGADPNAKDGRQWTPLHYAAEKGHTDIAQLLIDKGADPNGKNDSQKTPLHLAAFNGRADTAQLLIDKGADPTARDHEYYTPLHWAGVNGGAEIMKMLLAAVMNQPGHARRVAKRRDNDEPPQIGG